VVNKKYIATLTAEERALLEEMTHTGKAAARKIARARSCSRPMWRRVAPAGRTSGSRRRWT